MPFIPWLIAALGIFLRSRLGYIIASALLWMGIGMTTYTVALQPTVDLVISYATSGGGFGGQGGELAAKAAQWGGVLNLDRAITMWISAIFTRHSVTSARMFLSKVS